MERFSVRYTVAACAIVTLLAGCGGSQSQIGASGAMPSMPMAAIPRAVHHSPVNSPGLLPDAKANLYVANHHSVTVYDPNSGKLLRGISQGKDDTTTIAFHSGNLYVTVGPVKVKVYAKSSSKAFRTITQGLSVPGALAFDSSGNLFVANHYPGSVSVYPSNSGKLLRTISNGVGFPDALAFDGSGNLYVANQSSFLKKTGPTVTVYAPNKERPLRTLRTSTDPRALAFDGPGNLYVATTHAISVYSKGTLKLMRKISDGVSGGGALAFDSLGNLYVANVDSNTVTVYAKDSAKLLRTISSGRVPTSLALDGSGNLYVANWFSSTVTVYAPNSDKLLRTISNGVKNPQDLAFGP